MWVGFFMAFVRVLIDGYSLLHRWPELAPGRPRHLAHARDELIHVLTRYHDTTGERMTVFFDGTGTRPDVLSDEAGAAVEVLFSRAGRTADQMIERAAHRFQAYGEVLVVTDDRAERDVVAGMGAMTSSCANFIRMLEDALTKLQDELQSYNRAERNRFRCAPKTKSR
jgi:predicted RNA-binding protein with PIN domain